MNIISDIFLPLALAFIMFSLGLSLTGQDFLRIIKQPKDFILGSLSQIIILPLVAFLLILIWPISPELAIGIMLLASAPGGATSNIITSFAKGDVALSVSLTAIISLLSVITIPIIIVFSLDFITDIPFTKSISILDIAIKMFLIVTVPVLLGMLSRKIFINFSLFFEPYAKKISTVLFIIVLIGAIVSEKDNFISYFYQAGLITLVLNILMIAIAYSIAKFFGSGKKQQITILIECSLQNGTLAIVVGTTVFGGGIYLIPAATYSLIMFATTLIYVYFSRRIF